MNLTQSERMRLQNLSKGYEGELKFFYLLQEHLSTNSINLFDLRLEHSGNEFQMDSLLLFQHKAYLIEVKNFEGDLYLKDGEWFSLHSNNDIQNPVSQLQRCKLLLKKSFHQLGIHLPIESYLIFINPEFTLYNAPYQKHVIYAGQLPTFFRKLDNTPSTLSRNHREFKDKLVRDHITTSSRQRLPDFDDKQLKKGLICEACGGFLIYVNHLIVQCNNCKKEEPRDSAVLRSVFEFNVLFPGRKITLNSIYEWCGGSISKKVMRTILAENMEMVYQGRFSHYLFKQLKTNFEFPFQYDETRTAALRYFQSLDSIRKLP